jgi:hypothetical protein
MNIYTKDSPPHFTRNHHEAIPAYNEIGKFSPGPAAAQREEVRRFLGGLLVKSTSDSLAATPVMLSKRVSETTSEDHDVLVVDQPSFAPFTSEAHV